MNLRVRHRCGREQTVYAFRFHKEDDRATISWPLGECFDVNLDTGQLLPDDEQDPRVAEWSVVPTDLVALRELRAAAEQVVSVPIAEHPGQLSGQP